MKANSTPDRLSLLRFARLGVAILVAVVFWTSVSPLARHPETAAPRRADTGAPCRIVSMVLAGDEMLLDLLPRRCLRAVSPYAADPLYSNVAERAKGLTSVTESVEQIVKLQPDLVVLASYSDPVVREMLRSVGMNIYELRFFTSIPQIMVSVRELGRAVQMRDRAEALVASMRYRLSMLRERAKDFPSIRVLYYAFGGFVHGRNTSVDAVITASGAVNAAALMGIDDAREVPGEVVLSMKPDIILIGSSNPNAAVLAQARWAPTLRHLDAVQHGDVYALPHGLAGTVSHYTVEAAEALQDILIRYLQRRHGAAARLSGVGSGGP
ncbi:MAG: ABC transporter substrate-binding protein [Candidatus Tectomicrobia bacterium]|nr:ABC transporter substrate-binding protein [Candidatus Tectomicrobia bacterium]